MLKTVELCVSASGPKVQSAATACMLVTATVVTCWCQGYTQRIVKTKTSPTVISNNVSYMYTSVLAIGFVLTLLINLSLMCGSGWPIKH